MHIFDFVRNAMYILEGYTKWLFDIISGHSSRRAKERHKICSECEFNKNGICFICGCIIKAKVRVDFDLDENGKSIDGCPEKKW